MSPALLRLTPLRRSRFKERGPLASHRHFPESDPSARPSTRKKPEVCGREYRAAPPPRRHNGLRAHLRLPLPGVPRPCALYARGCHVTRGHVAAGVCECARPSGRCAVALCPRRAAPSRPPTSDPARLRGGSRCGRAPATATYVALALRTFWPSRGFPGPRSRRLQALGVEIGNVCKHVPDRKDEHSGRAEFWNRGQR